MHAFLLMVYLGAKIESQDMYFYDIDKCKYFASRLNNQPSVPNKSAREDAPKTLSYTAVCVPKRINNNIKPY